MENHWLNRLQNEYPKIRIGEVTKDGNGLRYSFLLEWSSPEAKARWLARQAARKQWSFLSPSLEPDPDEAED